MFSRLFRANEFADQDLPLLPIVFCPIRRMLSKIRLPYYHCQLGKVPKSTPTVLKIICGKHELKTALETVLRLAIGPMVWEELRDKRMPSIGHEFSDFAFKIDQH